MKTLQSNALTFLALCASIVLLSGCATEPSLYSGKKSYYAYSWEQELELGRKTDPQIVQEMGLYPDDDTAEYVDTLGQTLLAHSAMRRPDAPEIYRDVPFTFRVLDSPVVNAFALPGGYVYVTRGLLAHAQNEAQLAVIIGHEITHVEARHASQQALKQQWGQLGLAAGAILGEQLMENKELAQGLAEASGSLFQLVTLKYGRDAERESDQRGVEYAAKAGYDAAQGSEFFRSLRRISEKSGQRLPAWMSSHPDPGEREKTIVKLAEAWRVDGQPGRIEAESYLRRLEGLIVGEDPRKGYFDGAFFYHPEMKFQIELPSAWKYRNEPSAVEPSGAAMLSLNIAAEGSALEAANALRQRISLEPLAARDTRINGLTAYQIEGSVTQASGSLSVLATFVEHDGKVFTLLGYGTPEAFAAARPELYRSSSSFGELSNQAARNVQPFRMAIVAAERSAPFAELLPSRLPPGMDARDWAIINQVELDEHVERGTLLKLPKSL